MRRFNLVLEILSIVCLLAIFGYVIYIYQLLPQIIPSHYDSNGIANSYSDKSFLFGILTLVTVLYIGLTILNRYPQSFNYPVQITDENRADQYAKAQLFIRVLKLIIILVFGFILIHSTQNVLNKTINLNGLVLPIILIFLFLPIIIYLIVARKS
jgi:uncharacterized membrane protein